MGKKDAQRTKGNTKAASSARSAQMLGENAGFVGFGTTAESGFVPLLQPDDGVPSDFRLCMRKMTKKDVTTKLKALQEFLELTVTASEQDMLAVLNFWPSVYTKLATDIDRRVREQAHIALEAVVKAVGKNLALHLKSMSAVWYIGQSDSHTPAAQAATSAWKSAFPPQKLAGAVEFCQAEILSLIIENLISATPATMSDPKTTPPEEMEAKYVRTVSMSLTSYANLLDTVQHVEPDKHVQLLDSAKFWKLARHKDSNVRKAFYTAVTQLFIKMGDSLASRGEKVVPAVLGNLGDTEAGDAVWCCALQLLATLTEPWTFVSPHKAVFPAIWKLLGKTGAETGTTLRIYPYLMPFLSKIPVAVMEDCDKFLTRWFSAMLEGLEVIKARNNISGCKVVILSLLECIFYLCNSKEFDMPIKSKLIRDQLIPGLRMCPKSLSMLNSLSDYLLFWNKSAETNPDIAALNHLFWSELKFVGTQEDPDYYVDFILSLGKAIRLKQEENVKSNKEVNRHVPELLNTLKSIWKENLQNLQDPVTTLKSLATMHKLLADFGDQSSLFGLHDDQSRSEFYAENIVPLLGRIEVEESLAKLTWALAENMSESEGLNILDMFVKSTRPILIAKLIEAAQRSSKNSLFPAWIGCSGVQDLVVEIANNLVKSLVLGHTQNNENWLTIKSVLGAGVPVPEPTQRKLFSVFQEGLNSVKSKENKPTSSVRLIEFICDLVGLLTISHEDVLAEDTGTELIKLVFSLQGLNFSEATQDKLEACWLSATRKQPSLAQTLSSQIAVTLAKPLSLEELEKLAGQAKALVKVVTETNKDSFAGIVEKMMPQVEASLSEKAWYKVVLDQSQYFPELSDSFQCSFIQQSEVEPSNLILANQTYLLLSTLCQGFSLDPTPENESKTVLDDERVNLPEVFIQNSRLMSALVEGPLLVVYMQNLVLDKNSSPDVVRLEENLTTVATTFFSRLSKRNLDLVEKEIFAKCGSQADYYSLALCWLLGLTYRYSEWDLRLNRFMSLEEVDITTNYNTLVSFMQIISKYNIGSGTISSSLSLAVAKLVSLEGLRTDEGSCLLWFATQCLSLVRPGSRLHISGVSEFSGEIQTLLEMIPSWRAESEEQLLYNTDLSEHSWSEVNKVCVVMNLLNLVVSKYSELINSQVWDLITCSLVSWVGSMEESKDSLTSRAVSLMFGVTVSNLVSSVAAFLGPKGHHPSLSAPQAPTQPDPSPSLRDEWTEFFAEGIFTVLVPLYIKACAGKERLYSCNILSSALGQAIVHCPLQLLLQCELPPLYLVQDVDSSPMPDNITFIFNHFGPLLVSSCRSSQVTAAHILAAVSQEVPKSEDVTGDGEECSVPGRLVEVLNQGELLLSNLLVEYSISDPVGEIPTGTVAFSQTFGYLLSWRVILRLLEHSSDEVRPRYSQFLQTNNHIPNLLNNIFKLLPASSGQLEHVFTPAQLDVRAEPSSLQIQQLAASCWTQVCRHLPAFARQWWTKLDRESQTTVEKITCAQVTPALWSEEVSIINGADKSDNLTLKVRDSVREVVATYTIDEGSMELVVTLPPNYPLGGLNVDSGKKVGVETGQWRKWMLQLTTFLTHQNGSIHEGLNLWKKNVDKRFEGVEECYICFYILHGTNHQLPKLGCRTCKKKFHSACLYKWFSTSNNSSCPLCRNLF